MRPRLRWYLRSRALELGQRTLIMGVLNVTPDSFSDGGQYLEPQKAVERGLKLLDEGADIIDVGGESTRPGVAVGTGEPNRKAVTAQEELSRVLPVIEGLARERPEAILSVDTYKAEVARAAVNAGAEIVNDVSAFRWDSGLAQTCAELKCGVVLMHTRGKPEEWSSLEREPDIMHTVEHELADRVQAALESGVDRRRIVVDPGFGFGKNFEENYPVLAHLDRLHRLQVPILAGTSRKSFIGRTVAKRTGRDLPPEERLYGSIAAMVATVLKGAHVVRVHDVRPAVEASAVADQVLRLFDPSR